MAICRVRLIVIEAEQDPAAYPPLEYSKSGAAHCRKSLPKQNTRSRLSGELAALSPESKESCKGKDRRFPSRRGAAANVRRQRVFPVVIATACEHQKCCPRTGSHCGRTRQSNSQLSDTSLMAVWQPWTRQPHHSKKERTPRVGAAFGLWLLEIAGHRDVEPGNPWPIHAAIEQRFARSH